VNYVEKSFFNDETYIQYLKDCDLLPKTKLCTRLNSIGEQCKWLTMVK